MVQAMVPPPFAIRALWALQYFPMQLLPHTSTDPNNSHSQLFAPLLLTIGYILKMFFYLNTDFFYCKATLVHVCRCGMFFVLGVSEPPSAICVHAELSQKCFAYMQNWGPSACRCGMFFVQGGPEPASVYSKPKPNRRPDVFFVHAELG